MIAPDNTVRIHTICVSLGAMIAKVAAVRATTASDGSVTWTIVFEVGKDGALKPVKP